MERLRITVPAHELRIVVCQRRQRSLQGRRRHHTARTQATGSKRVAVSRKAPQRSLPTSPAAAAAATAAMRRGQGTWARQANAGWMESKAMRSTQPERATGRRPTLTGRAGEGTHRAIFARAQDAANAGGAGAAPAAAPRAVVQLATLAAAAARERHIATAAAHAVSGGEENGCSAAVSCRHP